MTGYLWAALGLLAGLAMTVLGDKASQEISDRLDHLPHAILRLAARRLTPQQRITIYQDEWLPELTYILRGAEARPITRLIIGIKFSVGLIITANRIARHLNRTSSRSAPEIIDIINGTVTISTLNAIIGAIRSGNVDITSKPTNLPLIGGMLPRAVFIRLPDGREMQMSHDNFDFMSEYAFRNQ